MRSDTPSTVDSEASRGITSGRKIFTDRAKAEVKAYLGTIEVDVDGEHSYPYQMPPSAEEDDYSLVSIVNSPSAANVDPFL